MKKDNIPTGSLFDPALREVVERLKDKEPELDALVDTNSESRDEPNNEGCEDETTDDTTRKNT